jgi:hypothetical protein
LAALFQRAGRITGKAEIHIGSRGAASVGIQRQQLGGRFTQRRESAGRGLIWGASPEEPDLGPIVDLDYLPKHYIRRTVKSCVG